VVERVIRPWECTPDNTVVRVLRIESSPWGIVRNILVEITSEKVVKKNGAVMR
jgi:hypothetical protein